MKKTAKQKMILANEDRRIIRRKTKKTKKKKMQQTITIILIKTIGEKILRHVSVNWWNFSFSSCFVS